MGEFRNFQGRISNYTGVRSGFSFFGFIKSTIICAVLVGVIYGALAIWLKTTDPGEMWPALQKQLKPILR